MVEKCKSWLRRQSQTLEARVQSAESKVRGIARAGDTMAAAEQGSSPSVLCDSDDPTGSETVESDNELMQVSLPDLRERLRYARASIDRRTRWAQKAMDYYAQLERVIGILEAENNTASGAETGNEPMTTTPLVYKNSLVRPKLASPPPTMQQVNKEVECPECGKVWTIYSNRDNDSHTPFDMCLHCHVSLGQRTETPAKRAQTKHKTAPGRDGADVAWP